MWPGISHWQDRALIYIPRRHVLDKDSGLEKSPVGKSSLLDLHTSVSQVCKPRVRECDEQQQQAGGQHGRQRSATKHR